MAPAMRRATDGQPSAMLPLDDPAAIRAWVEGLPPDAIVLATIWGTERLAHRICTAGTVSAWIHNALPELPGSATTVTLEAAGRLL